MNKDLLAVEGLKTYFYTSRGIVKAVDGVNLRIDKGETVGLVGESGCGKTVAALSIMQLVPTPPGRIIGGKVLFNGENLLALPEKEFRRRFRGKRISMVFQDPMTFLNPIMKIKDQIAETISLHQHGSVEDPREKAVELLRTVQIARSETIAECYPIELSGGMRQRVLIAIAISCNPDLLIADEPTTALDVTVQAQVLDLLKGVVENSGTSMLLITHDLGIVAETCDKVYVMYAGKIVEYGDVFQIFENNKHPYTQGLLKSTLSIDRFEKVLVTLDGTVPNLIDPPQGCNFHPRCFHAKAICREKESELKEIEKGHMVSCWLYG